MWPKEGKGHHLLSADGSRNNCPFSAGKLPQGIVLGWKNKVMRRKAHKDQKTGTGGGGGTCGAAKRAGHPGSCLFLSDASDTCDP